MLLLMGTSCSIKYKFNGATIDYTRIKTVTIEDFPNQAPLVCLLYTSPSPRDS